MQGPAGDPNGAGVNTRTLKELFRLADEKGRDVDIRMDISVLEIYCDSIRDLLSSPVQEDLQVKLVGKTAIEVVGLTKETITSVDAVEALIRRAGKNRSVKATAMNAESSRSHLVMQVDVITKIKSVGLSTKAALCMVDLAGSERVDKSGVTGKGFEEATAINKSLATLGNVLSSLPEKPGKLAPFRDSKLTRVLQNSLQGDSKVLMFCNINPARDNVLETIGSLDFATRARKVKLGKAEKNEAS